MIRGASCELVIIHFIHVLLASYRVIAHQWKLWKLAYDLFYIDAWMGSYNYSIQSWSSNLILFILHLSLMKISLACLQGLWMKFCLQVKIWKLSQVLLVMVAWMQNLAIFFVFSSFVINVEISSHDDQVVLFIIFIFVKAKKCI